MSVPLEKTALQPEGLRLPCSQCSSMWCEINSDLFNQTFRQFRDIKINELIAVNTYGTRLAASIHIFATH